MLLIQVLREQSLVVSQCRSPPPFCSVTVTCADLFLNAGLLAALGAGVDHQAALRAIVEALASTGDGNEEIDPKEVRTVMERICRDVLDADRWCCQRQACKPVGFEEKTTFWPVFRLCRKL
jgi:hypothetical protein